MSFLGVHWNLSSFCFDLVFCRRKNSSGIDDKVVPAGHGGGERKKIEQKGTFWRKNQFRNFCNLILTQNEKNHIYCYYLNKFSLRCLEICTNYATGCCFFFEVSVQIRRRFSTRLNVRAKHNSKNSLFIDQYSHTCQYKTSLDTIDNFFIHYNSIQFCAGSVTSRLAILGDRNRRFRQSLRWTIGIIMCSRTPHPNYVSHSPNCIACSVRLIILYSKNQGNATWMKEVRHGLV